MNTLDHAAEAYAEGQITLSRDIALACLSRARLRGDGRMEARSHWQLAQADVVFGNVAAALAQAQRASHLFESLTDREGETRSLITVAYCAAQLCDNGLALASAQRALRLSEAMDSPALRAAASNYLGVALFWDGDSTAADARLQAAMGLARQAVGSNAHVRPMVNRATGELVRLTLDHVYDDAPPEEPSRLAPMVEELRACKLAGAMPFLSAGQHIDCEAIAAWPHVFLDCWNGDLGSARACLEVCKSRAESDCLAWHWVTPYVAWAEHELACSAGRWSEAAAAARRMVAHAGRLQNHQLVRLGSMLELRVLGVLGLDRDAFRGWRALHRREAVQRLTLRSNSEWLFVPQRAGARAVVASGPPTVADGRTRLQRAVDDWKRRYGLTDAEGAVLELLGQAMPLGRIAARRGTRVGTVRAQLAALFDKTGHRSQQALIAALCRDAGEAG